MQKKRKLTQLVGDLCTDISRRLGTFVEEYGRLNENDPSTSNVHNTRNKRQKLNIDDEGDEDEDEQEDEGDEDEDEEADSDSVKDDVDSHNDNDNDEDGGANASDGNDTRNAPNESNDDGHSQGGLLGWQKTAHQKTIHKAASMP